MKHHKDNGSFESGFFTAIVILAAFICGYALRDSGFKVDDDRPPVSAPIQRI
jgi:hypothetical protein